MLFRGDRLDFFRRHRVSASNRLWDPAELARAAAFGGAEDAVEYAPVLAEILRLR